MVDPASHTARMEIKEHMSNDSITAAKGFLAAGLACGLKVSGRADLGLLVCPTGATAAAMFTTNRITSAAVQVAREHASSDTIYAVVVNSGNANACTGAKGLADARKMCTVTAKALKVRAEQVLVASTGIIGEQMPIDKAVSGIGRAAAQLSDSAEAGAAFTRAIMTTDTKPKSAVRRIEISDQPVTLAGTVKGAGMIGPNMATTLLFVTTDAAIAKPMLRAALKDAIGNSLNKLTVDGHQSTNDTAILLASGAAGYRPITTRCPRFRKFASALADLCTELVRQMALDAEGATRMFKVVVNGAATAADAARAARAVADYPLVKCAVHGGDPNWGRIICAVGSCGVKLDPARLSCKLDDLYVFKNGTPARFDAQRASEIVSQTEHTITVHLGAGAKSDFCYGCDLSGEYVRINADYHT